MAVFNQFLNHYHHNPLRFSVYIPQRNFHGTSEDGTKRYDVSFHMNIVAFHACYHFWIPAFPVAYFGSSKKFGVSSFSLLLSLPALHGLGMYILNCNEGRGYERRKVVLVCVLGTFKPHCFALGSWGLSSISCILWSGIPKRGRFICGGGVILRFGG